MLTPKEAQDVLLDIIQGHIEDNDECPVTQVRTYEEAGILNHEHGLVVTIDDEQEFRLSMFLVTR